MNRNISKYLSDHVVLTFFLRRKGGSTRPRASNPSSRFVQDSRSASGTTPTNSREYLRDQVKGQASRCRCMGMLSEDMIPAWSLGRSPSATASDCRACVEPG